MNGPWLVVLLRRKSPVSGGCIVVKSAQEAADYLKSTDGNILLTTGAKELSIFSKLDSSRLFPRILTDDVVGEAAADQQGMGRRFDMVDIAVLGATRWGGLHLLA